MDEPSSPEDNAITLRIKFKSASLDEFVARYGADVSAGGIFIRTKQPLAVGSLLRFDFSLANGSSLLAGLGTVVWVREPDQSRVGSIPGMGLRFDQLAPESQPIHQQILAAKAGRADRPSPMPSPTPPPVPVARPATPPPIVPRPAPAPPVAGQPARRATSNTFEELSSGGTTEIADKPPSFHFDSMANARGVGAGARQEAAPSAPVEDTETDSRKLAAADSSWSEPIDIEEAGAVVSSSGAAAAPAAPADSGRARGVGGALARQLFDLPPMGSTEPAPVADLSPPSVPAKGATAGGASYGALKPATGQSWLDQAMEISDSVGEAPRETAAEHTEEMPAPPEAALTEAPAPGSGEAQAPTFQDVAPSQSDIRDLGPQKPAAQGRKLIVVGIVAAGLAFAGVYLLQTKPWQPRVAPASSPTPAIPERAPAVPPAAPQVRAPLPPAAPAAPPAAQAEPVKPAPSAAQTAPAKPAEKVLVPKPTEAAKPEESPTLGKHPDQAAGSSKKTASKPAPPPPGSGREETVYMLKVRSLPIGAQVLIDDEPMGQTPFQRRILDIDKSHKVTIRRLGYEPYEHIVTSADARAKDGNTETMKLVAKLKRSKVQADAPSAVPEAQPAPVPEQPKP